jgi:hypothetical protein
MTEDCTACKLGPCKTKSRRCEGLDEDLEELSGGVKADWYPRSAVNSDGTVSVEAAGSRELDLKQQLDDQVEGENVYHVGVEVKGLPPCKRVKKSF